MVTESERRVIEAAQAWRATMDDSVLLVGDPTAALAAAVDALQAEGDRSQLEAPDATGPITVAPLRVLRDERTRLTAVAAVEADDTIARRKYPIDDKPGASR